MGPATITGLAKQSCPNCGNRLRRIRIVYGNPTIEAAEKEARGEVVLEGCLIGDHDPNWACAACRQAIVTAAASSNG